MFKFYNIKLDYAMQFFRYTFSSALNFEVFAAILIKPLTLPFHSMQKLNYVPSSYIHSTTTVK